MQPGEAGTDWTPWGTWCAVASEMFVTHADLNLMTDLPLTQPHHGEVDQRFQGPRFTAGEVLYRCPWCNHWMPQRKIARDVAARSV